MERLARCLDAMYPTRPTALFDPEASCTIRPLSETPRFGTLSCAPHVGVCAVFHKPLRLTASVLDCLMSWDAVKG